MDQVLTYISTCNITELNELIYAGAKLVCEKVKKKRENTGEWSENGTFQNNKENSINKMTRKHTNNRMQKKPNDLGLKHGNQRTAKSPNG